MKICCLIYYVNVIRSLIGFLLIFTSELGLSMIVIVGF